MCRAKRNRLRFRAVKSNSTCSARDAFGLTFGVRLRVQVALRSISIRPSMSCLKKNLICTEDKKNHIPSCSSLRSTLCRMRTKISTFGGIILLGGRYRLVQYQRLPPGHAGRQHSQYRPHRPGRRTVHRLLRRAELHRGALRLHHRPAIV